MTQPRCDRKLSVATQELLAWLKSCRNIRPLSQHKAKEPCRDTEGHVVTRVQLCRARMQSLREHVVARARLGCVPSLRAMLGHKKLCRYTRSGKTTSRHRVRKNHVPIENSLLRHKSEIG